MIAALRDHQRKGHGLRDALRSEGWWVVPHGAPADVLLIDADLDRPGYRDVIQAYEASGAKIILYPHGGNTPVIWDGLEVPYPVDACLAIGTGQRGAMLTYGYPHPIEVIGWFFCEQRPFQPRKIERVLFAPIHPLGNGYLPDVDKAANVEAYRAILTWGLPVTIRHLGPLEASGLWLEPAVQSEQGRGTGQDYGRVDDAVRAIDEHDLVVAQHTFLSLAVARGVPAVTFYQTPQFAKPW